MAVQCKARRCYEGPSRQLKNDPEKTFRASRGTQIGATRLYTLPSAVNILPYQSLIASAASEADTHMQLLYKRTLCLAIAITWSRQPHSQELGRGLGMRHLLFLHYLDTKSFCQRGLHLPNCSSTACVATHMYQKLPAPSPVHFTG